MRFPATVLAMLASVWGSMNIASGATYHLDPSGGNDLWVGTSPETAWQSLSKLSNATLSPGDTVLLKRGGNWTGQLAPKGSGTAAQPIRLDAYGSGALPRIDGGGIAGPAVLLYNVEYWEVQNLEITNNATSDSISRSGIRVYHDTGTVAHHIHLKNLHVHDVRGSNDFNTGKGSGGIQINAGGTFQRYDDVLVEGCLVHDVKRVGITINGSIASDLQPVTGYGTGIVMRGNIIYNTGGDGSIIRYAISPLIERNVVHDFPTGGGGASWTVGLWCRSTLNALFQFNEVYNSTTTNDGQAYDSDIFSDGTVFQYNYSHDNLGGFMLLMNSSSNSTLRYNISRNDRGILIHYSLGLPPNTRIYNNTFYIANGTSTKILGRNSGDDASKKTYWNNNLVYNLGSGGYDSLGGLVADYNAYFGNHPASEPAEAHKVTANPKLAAPGTGGTGFATLGGYQLLDGSPLINTGTTLAGFAGVDFLGNPLTNGPTDIGAHEYAVPVPVIQTVTPSGSNLAVQFSTVTNATYTVQASGNLSPGSWSTISTGISGTGAPATVIDTGGSAAPQRFFRLQYRTP